MQNIPRTSLSCIVCLALACTGLLGYTSHSFAWGRDAHTAIGVMAVNRLQPDVLRELQSIVDPLTKSAMTQACNWADEIRETEEGKWSAPLHYVNIPRGEALYSASRDCPKHETHKNSAQRPAQYCVTEAIKFYAAGLGRQEASPEQRGQAFAWLCHLVADLHQPLHAGFAHDRGANTIEVIYRGEPMNLHHFWDSALISHKAGNWQYLIGELIDFPPDKSGSDWSPGMVDVWTSESHQLAAEAAYPKPESTFEHFAEESWALTQRQLRQAAERLALIINTQLNPAEQD